MLKSSESIAALAAALARAQLELTNPEKSLTATLPAVSPREEARTYRYASLATGLDIVRKSLGRQEIAAVQGTVIDQQTGLVRLMTVLAHSSGEWLSSEWPVCPIADTANPQRMGAALTYARRYALFTLVGIAGEDDLDAPEPSRPLAAAANGRTSPGEAAPNSSEGRPTLLRNSANGSRPPPSQQADQILPPVDSEALREALLVELSLIQSIDGLTRWAYRRLRSKNILQDGDARVIESAFQAKIDAASEVPPATASEIDSPAEANDRAASSTLAGGPITTPSPEVEDGGKTPTRSPPPTEVAASSPSRVRRRGRVRNVEGPTVSQNASPPDLLSASGNTTSPGEGSLDQQAPLQVGSPASPIEHAPATAPRTAVDKSVLHLDEPKRIRDKEHLQYVAAQPCLLCSTRPSDAHHIRFAQPRALGRKVSDEFAVPLCRQHHRDVHDSGNEAAWWHDIGIDPIEIAHQLWHETSVQRLLSPGRD